MARFPYVLCLAALGFGILNAQSTEEGLKWQWGFEERVRSEDWDDIIDHDATKADARTHYRFRTRVWGQVQKGGWSFAAGLNNENRKTTRPGNYPYNGREVFFETLNVGYRFSQEWALTVGRQNLMRGEGFILMDGTPGDGSRSLYFNALDLVWTPGNSKLELMAISNPSKDKYLPVLNKIENQGENRLVEWDERAIGLYFTQNLGQGAQGDAYYFYKSETKLESKPEMGRDRRFHTLGGRLLQPFGEGWSFAIEAAGQQGKIRSQDREGARDIEAWGGYTRLKKAFDASWKPSLSLGYIGLSGQDPRSTDRSTAWQPLFGRWPKWGELYIYTQIPETRVAHWTNTGMWELEFKCKPSAKWDLRATYYKMDAYQPLTAATHPILATGKNRGDVWQARVDYQPIQSLKTHLLYEYLKPGNAYRGQDAGYFLRFDVSWTLGGSR